MNNTPKSALTAGVLGIFLGAFGMHDWYLGRQKPAKRHVILLIVGVAMFGLSMIARALISAMTQLAWANSLNSIATILRIIGWITLVANVVWGVIEGILLIVQGDAVLQTNSTVATAADPSTPAPKLRVELPPTPTLAEQALGAQTAPQPIVFRASDITMPQPVQPVTQPLGTKNVPMAPLTVASKNGKATINPIVLRRILIVTVIIVVAAVGGILLKNGISSVIAAGYQQTYRAAKELAPRIATAHQSQSCRYVVDFVDAVMINNLEYGQYIQTCGELVVGVKPLIDHLGETTAMGWNADIAEQYQNFQELYNEAFPEDNGLTENLQSYQLWHNFLVTTNALTVDSPESEFRAAADMLRESGNLTLAKYSEEWLDRQLAYLQEYHEYWDTSYAAEDKEAQRVALEAQRAELQDWVRDHQPKIIDLVRIFVPDTEPMYESFTKLYDLIKVGYENHYDYKSNDCNAAGGKVYCS